MEGIQKKRQMKGYNKICNPKSSEINMYLDTLQALSESTDDYLYLWELQSGRIWFFGEIAEKYNLMIDGEPYCTAEEWQSIIYPRDLTAITENLQMIEDEKITVHNMDYRLRDRRGNLVWINCRGKVQVDAQGRSFAMIGRVSDTILRHKVDGLTGMFNMAKMSEDLEQILDFSRDGFLMILGVDNLKHINIKKGREYGNHILKLVAQVLEDVAESSQRIYRLDRDYFAVCMPGKKQEDVQSFYDKIQKAVDSNCTLSAGAAPFFYLSGKDTERLYQYAEDALDKAKKAGKNGLEFFSEDDYKKKVSTIELIEELERSVQDNCSGFSLVYQSQIKAGSYQLFGAEALLRYDSPIRGRVMPDEFIPLLEQTGLICPVGLWVLKTALNQCSKWRKNRSDFHISVNISYVQLKQPDIVEQVLNIVESSGVPGEALTLEVTESMQLQDFQHYNEIFTVWKSAGIEIAVDDFGTGYSSLGYLKHLKIDEIKIDRCFVSGIQHSSYNYRLLKNMLQLAADTQIYVCCEGVEEKEELQVLEELKPDLIQGYLFSKPCETEQFERIYFNSDDCEYQKYQKHIGQVKKRHWGELLHLQHRDILKAIDLGLWVIRINEKTGNNEMYADETMYRIMAADKNLSPEECYVHWYSHINNGYYNYVNRSVNSMISSGQIVQLQYTWNHPTLGEVQVRCTGVRTEDNDGMVCLEGYHRMISSIDQTSFLEDESSDETFEYNEHKGTIYFHTARALLTGEKLHEHGFPECWVREKLVHPHFSEVFYGMFHNVRNKENADGVELMLKSKTGEYAWFKMNTRHLSEEESDRDTILIQLNAANQERQIELENMRIRDFYRASLSEAIAYAELDMESGYIQDVGGLWTEYVQTYDGQVKEFLQYLINCQNTYTSWDKGEKYEICSDVGKLKHMMKEESRIHRFTYKDWIISEWRWVELVIHTFKEKFSQNMYALLYLKDIDVQKRHEIAQQEAAETDPLTRVYNRKTFEEEVCRYLLDTSEIRQGILMLLDIDNFKSVNDKIGHSAGDSLLKYVAECLENVFYQNGIIGRFGGDEFLVFVKGEVKKEQFDQYMEQLFSALEEKDDEPASCSAGIAFVFGKEFSYQESIRLVDEAMYWSKRNGKHRYHWHETKCTVREEKGDF